MITKKDKLIKNQKSEIKNLKKELEKTNKKLVKSFLIINNGMIPELENKVQGWHDRFQLINTIEENGKRKPKSNQEIEMEKKRIDTLKQKVANGIEYRYCWQLEVLLLAQGIRLYKNKEKYMLNKNQIYDLKIYYNDIDLEYFDNGEILDIREPKLSRNWHKIKNTNEWHTDIFFRCEDKQIVGKRIITSLQSEVEEYIEWQINNKNK